MWHVIAPDDRTHVVVNGDIVDEEVSVFVVVLLLAFLVTVELCGEWLLFQSGIISTDRHILWGHGWVFFEGWAGGC